MLHSDILQTQINCFSCTIHKQIFTDRFLSYNVNLHMSSMDVWDWYMLFNGSGDVTHMYIVHICM